MVFPPPLIAAVRLPAEVREATGFDHLGINWEASGTERFTIPIGLGINKTVQFGKLPVRFGVEVYYSVWRPNNVPATEWNLRFYAIPAVPSALFSWM